MNTECVSISGKIRTFIVDKTLTINGACADAKVVGQKLNEIAGMVNPGGGGSGGVTVDQVTEIVQDEIGKLDYATTETYAASVSTSWASNNTQTVSVSGILATDNPVVDVVLGSDADANEAYLEAWGMVNRIVTADGSVTLYATDVPETAFTIQLKVVR